MMQAVVFVGGPIARRRMAAIKWHRTGPNRDRDWERDRDPDPEMVSVKLFGLVRERTAERRGHMPRSEAKCGGEEVGWGSASVGGLVSGC